LGKCDDVAIFSLLFFVRDRKKTYEFTMLSVKWEQYKFHLTEGSGMMYDNRSIKNVKFFKIPLETAKYHCDHAKMSFGFRFDGDKL
jgi:hypothetical protein